MIRNYFKIAWRSLKRQPFFTFLNIFGLTIGIAGSLLIGLYIYDELSFDKMFTDADRIHRVNADIKFGGVTHDMSKVPAPMAQTMLNDCQQVEMVTRIRDEAGVLIKKKNSQNNIKEKHATYVDANFFDMFGVDLLAGQTHALKEQNTLVLTKTTALKHFETIHSAVGQQLIINNNKLYTVTGIVNDFPKNSFLRNHTVLVSTSGYSIAQENQWGDFNFYTFVKLLPNANIDNLETVLKGFVGKYLVPWMQTFFPGMTEESFFASGNYLYYETIPLTDIHLSGNKEEELSPNSAMQNVYILSCIGLFLIVLASVNFINLSTASSLKRAKEVGIRKTLGSNRLSLIKQFLTESGLISFIALLVAIGVAALTLPFFNTLVDKTIEIPFGNPIFWLILIVCTVLLGSFSGMYPAFFMSRFIPVHVLKGSTNSSTKGGGLRNSLVVFQFSISVVLIAATIVVYQQLNFIQNKDLGYTKDQVLIIDDVHGAGDRVQAFKAEVQKLSNVKSASVSGYLPTPSLRRDRTYRRSRNTDQDNPVNMQSWEVDYDYISTMGMEIIAGRGFDKQFTTDIQSIVLNESAIELLGVTPEEAIGMNLSEKVKIIGVVKNFHFESLKDKVGALGLTIGNSNNSMAVLLTAGDFSNTISKIESIWNDIAPGEPFAYNFMEDSFNTVYKEEQKLGVIFMIFTILSILIACLGLFGLAAFNAQKHFKEIGIRKVLGATVNQITLKLVFTFLKLVGIAILISLPISWYAMNVWLQDFSYRIDISWQTFAFTVLIVLGVAVLTISFQSIKAAIANPIKSLRTE